MGQVALRVIHTPGHRPEHCSFAVIDRSRADEPWLVLTGDSLLVGDTARPDLAVEAKEGAEGLFHSLRRLLELPDGVELFPGHVAGSLCGAGMSSKASSTIGFERRFNPSLAHTELADFIAESAASSGTPRPPNMERIVELNRGMFVGARPPLTRLSSADGATILDVRQRTSSRAAMSPARSTFRAGGSSSRPRPVFVLGGDERVALYAGSEDEAQLAARGAARGRPLRRSPATSPEARRARAASSR